MCNNTPPDDHPPPLPRGKEDGNEYPRPPRSSVQILQHLLRAYPITVIVRRWTLGTTRAPPRPPTGRLLCRPREGAPPPATDAVAAAAIAAAARWVVLP